MNLLDLSVLQVSLHTLPVRWRKILFKSRYVEREYDQKRQLAPSTSFRNRMSAPLAADETAASGPQSPAKRSRAAANLRGDNIWTTEFPVSGETDDGPFW